MWHWPRFLKRGRPSRKAPDMSVPAIRDQIARKAAARRRVSESEALLEQVNQRDVWIAAHVAETKLVRAENGFAAVVLEAFKGIS